MIILLYPIILMSSELEASLRVVNVNLMLFLQPFDHPKHYRHNNMALFDYDEIKEYKSFITHL